MKICIVTISLGGGGAERSTALLSKMLSQSGLDVHLVTLNDVIDYPYEGTLFNLGSYKNKEQDTLLEQVKRIRLFRKYLIQQNFDYIIDNRNRNSSFKELVYLKYLYRGFRIIYVVRSFIPYSYLPKNYFIAKQMIRKSFAMIGVSKSICQYLNSFYNTSKFQCIYNPIETTEIQDNYVSGKPYILYLGRLEEPVKNISLLLEGYALSLLPEKGIKLYIMGDGPDKDFVQDKVNQMGLNQAVTLFSFDSNIHAMLSQAYFLPLTSRNEGFPRVLIEALAAGIPVVAVDCESGPGEIVQHEFNGLLVENHKPDTLADAFNRMINEPELYRQCKQNSQGSVRHLHTEIIAQEWLKLLH